MTPMPGMHLYLFHHILLLLLYHPVDQLYIPSASSRVDDRDSNLILFGLPDSPSIFDTKKLIDEVLQFLAECSNQRCL